jgi:NAD(P)-dependent dehydrogenase (short-subunit alcohol dehydrogenase family)
MSKTWFITGISRGFGRAMAEKVLDAGDRVAGTVRDVSSVSDLKSRYADRLSVSTLDLNYVDEAVRVTEQIFSDLGQIDVVVSNAGYGLFGPVESLTVSKIENQINTNLVSPIAIIKSAVPYLRRQGGGRIIGISSYGGQAVHPGASVYHASKWGLEGFLESISVELAPFGIGVSIVEPGGARTGFRELATKNLGNEIADYKNTPAGMVHAVLKDASRIPAGDPEKVAAAIIKSVDVSPSPRRIILGSDAFKMITQALTERLAETEAQRETASETDWTS